MLTSREETIADRDETHEQGIKKMPTGISPEDFGGFVHRFLYEWLSETDGADHEAQRLLGTLTDRYHMKPTMRSKVIDAAGKLVKTFRDQMPWVQDDLYKLEWPIQLRLGSLVFHGVVDRVDKTNDGLYVIDYKIGVVREEYAFQIQFYAWIIKRLSKETIAGGAVAYLHKEPESVTVDVSQDTLQHIETASQSLDEALLSGDYHASPGVVCSSCDFNTICPHAVS
jgi:CRISPR/Cas system-associated exonuclease Cas4 (RecB family)